MHNALVLEPWLPNEGEWNMIRVYWDYLRIVEEVALKPLQRHDQRQCLLLDGRLWNLMGIQPSRVVSSWVENVGVLVILMENSPDAYSAGIHWQMEGFLVVWCSENRGRGEEGLDMFESLLGVLRLHKAPLDTRERGQRSCYRREVWTEPPVVPAHAEEFHHLASPPWDREA